MSERNLPHRLIPGLARKHGFEGRGKNSHEKKASSSLISGLASILFGLGEQEGIPAGLMSDRLYLRHPRRSDYEQWTTLRAASVGFLQPWEPVWPKDDLTPQGFQRRLGQYERDIRSGRSLPYLIFRKSDDVLLGGINVSNIRRGICQMASVGYWMGESFAGHGHMGRALGLLLPHLFDNHGLHRIEAACIPDNLASIAVLRRQGFQMEGTARRYLCINGQWEDHLLFALLRDDLQTVRATLGKGVWTSEAGQMRQGLDP